MNFHEFLTIGLDFIQNAFNNKCDVFAPKDQVWENLCGLYLRNKGSIHHLCDNSVFERFMKEVPRNIEDFKGKHCPSVLGTYPQFFLNLYSVIQANDEQKVREEISVYLYFLHEICDTRNVGQFNNNSNDIKSAIIECNSLYSIYRKVRNIGGEKREIYTHERLIEIFRRNRNIHPIDARGLLLSILE